MNITKYHQFFLQVICQSRRNIKYSLLSLLLLISGQIFGYTTRVDTLTLDFNGQAKSAFGTNDAYFTIRTRAYFCIETAYSAGQYRFVVRITDSRGALVKEYVSAKNNLPASQSQIIEDTISQIPFTLLKGPGLYRISSTFEEFYPERTSSLPSYGMAVLEFKDSGYDNSLFTTGIRLISPAKGSQVLNPQPFFQWMPSLVAKKYTIYVSDNPDPEVVPLWMEKNVTGTLIQYPAGVRQLEKGKKYYWMVRGLDALDRPVGPNFGRSEVFDFYLSEGNGDRIILKYPVDGTKVTGVPFEFEWEGFLGKFTYEVTLSADSEGTEKIWTTDSTEYKTFYPLSAPDLIPGKKYYWRVRSIIKGFEQSSKSETGEFVYSPSLAPPVDNTIPAGSAGVTGQIFDSAGRPIPDAIFSAEGPSDNPDAYKVLSVLSDSTGKFSLPLVPGLYKLKIYKNRYDLQELSLKIEPAKVVQKNFSLFGNTTELYGTVINAYTGDVIPGAAVILKNAFFEDKLLTTDAGVFNFRNLKPGKYTAEIRFSPFFNTSLQNVEIIAGENKANFQLEPVLVGSVRGKLFEKETGNGLPFANITVENISLAPFTDIVTAPVQATPAVLYNGEFEVAALKAGKYKISVSTTGYPPQERQIDVTGGSETKADFEYSRKRVAISGKIVRGDGSGVYRAEISVKNLPDISVCYTSGDGSFSCQFPQGTMTLGFYYPGLSGADKQITAESDQNIGIITLDRPTGVLNVKVKDLAGNLLSGIQAKVLDYAPLTDQIFTSDSSGNFPDLKLPLWQAMKISFTDTSGNFLDKITPVRLESESENLTESLSRLIAIKGSTLSASLQPLGETTINIPGSSFAAISGGDGKFMMSLAELNPMPETITLVFKRPGYYTETRAIMTNMLFAPVDVRMRDEQEKVTSFTSVRINNSIREIRSELEDVQAWVQRTITKVKNDLNETQRIADAYQVEIDSKLTIIAQKKAELEIEAQKPYLTAKALKLSVELRGLSEDVQISTNAMSLRVTGMLDTIQRFVDLFKRAVELKLPTLEMRITNLLDSVTESPFLDEETRAHLKNLAINIKTQYDVEVKAYCQNGLAEIDRLMKEIGDKMRQNLAIVVAKNKENAASIQAFVDGISEKIAIAQAAAQNDSNVTTDPDDPDNTTGLPTTSGPIEKVDEDDVIINVTNSEDLRLALKIADIINERNKMQNKIKAAIAKLNDIPLGLKKFSEKADIVNYNLTNAKSKLDRLKTEIDRYGKLYAQAQSYAWNIEQIINLSNVGGFQLDPYIEKVTGDDTKVKISGSLVVVANNLGSWNIPLVPFEYDLASAIDKEIIKLRSGDITSHTYFDAGGKADPRKLLIKQDVAEYNTRKTRSSKNTGAAVIASAGLTKDKLNEMQLDDFKDVSNVENLFPQELLKFKDTFLPKNLANLAGYADSLPDELKNFDPQKMFPAKINNFDLETLTDADKAEILDSDAYEYVWRQVNLFIKKQVPSVKAEFENLDDEFLMRKYVPGEVRELYEVSKSNNEADLNQKFMYYLPTELTNFKSSAPDEKPYNILMSRFSTDADFTKFLKLYLSADLSKALPEDITQIKCNDVGPDFICSFDPQKVKDDAQKSLEEKIFSPELPIDGEYTLGAASDTAAAVKDASQGKNKKPGYNAPKSPLPFDMGLRRVRLGFEKTTRRAYLVSDLFVNVEKLKFAFGSGSEAKKQEITFGDFKIFGDRTTSANEFKFSGNLGGEISGFAANITEFGYNHQEQKVRLAGSITLKIPGAGKGSTITINRCIFGYDDGMSKWTLDEFGFDLQDGIPIGPIVLNGMDYVRVGEKVQFKGSFKPKAIGNHFMGSELNLTKIGFARDIETGSRFFELAEGENLKIDFIKPYAAFSVAKLSIRLNKAEYELQLQNSAMEFLWEGVIHDPNDSSKPYSVKAGLVQVNYEYSVGPKQVRMEGLSMVFRPWTVKETFTFGPTNIDVSAQGGVGQKTIWNVGFCLQLGVSIAGASAENYGKGGNSETCFRIITDDGIRLEHAKLDIGLGFMEFKGVLTIEKRYFYAQVQANLFHTSGIKGEFYLETSSDNEARNWFVSAEIKGFSIPVITIGVLGVSISGGGIKIGERDSKLVLGISAMMAVDSGAGAASPGFKWFEGNSRISYVSGADMLTIEAKGQIIPQILPEIGDVFVQLQILFKDTESSIDMLAMTKLDLMSMVVITSQMDVHLGLDYMVASVIGATKLNLGNIATVNVNGGFAFGAGLREEAMMPASVSYDGTQFRVPQSLVGGFVIFFNSNTRIDLDKFIKTDILKGSVLIGAGAALVVDFGRPVVGAGLYGYFNGQASLLAIVQISVYYGFDIGGQIGKTKSYFSGLGVIKVGAKIAFLELGPFSVSVMVRVGDVPDDLPDKPAGFDPNFKPKGSVDFLVQDMFGIPMPNATVAIEKNGSCTTNARGRCIIQSLPLNSRYAPKVTDGIGLYKYRELITPDGTLGGMVKDFELEFSGQKIVAVMAPTELLNHLLVHIELPDETIKACGSGIPEFQVELVSKKTGGRKREMARCFPADEASAERAVEYKHSLGVYAVFQSVTANEEYYPLLIPSSGSKYKDTTGGSFKLSDLPAADVDGVSQMEHKKVSVKPDYAKMTLSGYVKSGSGPTLSLAASLLPVKMETETVTLLDQELKPVGSAIETSTVGYFEIPDVKTGLYTVKVEKKNYKTKYKKVYVTKGLYDNQNIEIAAGISGIESDADIETGVLVYKPPTDPITIYFKKKSTSLTLQTQDGAGKGKDGIALQLMKSGKSVTKCVTSSGKCEFEDLEVNEEYTILREKTDTTIFSGISESKIAKFKDDQISVEMAEAKDETITLFVQTGPKITGRIVDENGGLVTFDPETDLILEYAGTEKSIEFHGKSDSKGNFEMVLASLDKSSVAELTIDVDGFEAIAFDVDLVKGPVNLKSGKSAIELGEIQLQSSADLGELLKKKPIKTPGGHVLRIEDAVPASSAASKIREAKVFKIKGDMLFQKSGAGYLNGEIALQDILVEVKAKGNGEFEYAFVTEKLESSNISSTTDAKLDFMGGKGSAKDLQINLASPVITAGASMVMQKIPRLDCGATGLRISTTSPVLKISATGDVTSNLAAGKEAVFQLENKTACKIQSNVGGDGLKFEPSSQIKLTNASGILSNTLTLGITGNVKLGATNLGSIDLISEAGIESLSAEESQNMQINSEKSKLAIEGDGLLHVRKVKVSKSGIDVNACIPTQEGLNATDYAKEENCTELVSGINAKSGKIGLADNFSVAECKVPVKFLNVRDSMGRGNKIVKVRCEKAKFVRYANDGKLYWNYTDKDVLE